MLLGSTNTGFRASSFLAKSWACAKRWGKGRPSRRSHLRAGHVPQPCQTRGCLGLPSRRRTHRRGTHPPKLQALVHDGVGREEDQEPVGDDTGDVAWKGRGSAQPEGCSQGPPGAPNRESRHGRGPQAPRNGVGAKTELGLPTGTHLAPYPGRTSTHLKTCTKARSPRSQGPWRVARSLPTSSPTRPPTVCQRQNSAGLRRGLWGQFPPRSAVC